MPGYRGHLMGGAAAFGITFALLRITKVMLIDDPYIILGCFLCSMTGSLFPDIDVKSKGQNLFYWLLLGLLLYFFYKKDFLTLSCIAIAATLPMLVRHRGVFHNIWFLMGILSALSYLLMCYVPHFDHLIMVHMIFFVAGAISHVWLDLGFKRMWHFR